VRPDGAQGAGHNEREDRGEGEEPYGDERRRAEGAGYQRRKKSKGESCLFVGAEPVITYG